MFYHVIDTAQDFFFFPEILTRDKALFHQVFNCARTQATEKPAMLDAMQSSIARLQTSASWNRNHSICKLNPLLEYQY